MSRTEPPSAPGWRQGVTLIALAAVPTMAIAALVAVLPTFFEHFRGAPHGELLVPMILTVPSLCVALFAAPLGALADRWGRQVPQTGSHMAPREELLTAAATNLRPRTPSAAEG